MSYLEKIKDKIVKPGPRPRATNPLADKTEMRQKKFIDYLEKQKPIIKALADPTTTSAMKKKHKGKKVPVWYDPAKGEYILALRYGSRPVEPVAEIKDGSGLSGKSIEELIDNVDNLVKAVQHGELDTALMKAAERKSKNSDDKKDNKEEQKTE